MITEGLWRLTCAARFATGAAPASPFLTIAAAAEMCSNCFSSPVSVQALVSDLAGDSAGYLASLLGTLLA